MKPIPYCVPDALEMVLATAKLVSDEEFIHRKVLSLVLSELGSGSEFGSDSVELVYRCLTTSYKALGVKDPYENEKARVNKAMLGLEKSFREYLDISPDRLSACINLVMAGSLNNIEALGRAELEREILEHLDAPVARDDRESFMKSVSRSKRLMFICGNAGEIVLDKLLIEELAKRCEVTAVVAAKPILSTATEEDAKAIGLDQFAKVITPGAAMLGLRLEKSSSQFREAFNAADVIIAKGEINFETLKNSEREQYFMFQTRCESLSNRLGVELGSNMFSFHRGRPGTGIMEAATKGSEEKQV